MAGTKEGGARAAATNKAKYGEDFYKSIGSLGGQAKGIPKGFGAGEEGKERARVFGAIGGAKSKRGPSKGLQTKSVE